MVLSIKYTIFFCCLFSTLHTSNGKKVILRNGTMDVWFQQAFLLSGVGPIWEPQGTKVTAHKSDDPGFSTLMITKTADIQNSSQLMYVDIEAKVTNRLNDSICYFQVFIYRKDGKPNLPRTKDETLKFLLANFTTVYNITVSKLERKEIKTFKFRRNGSDVTFGIVALGVSGELYSMNMYYYYCEETIYKGLRLPNTISPDHGLKEVMVNCSKNSLSASNETTLKVYCLHNGTWRTDAETKCFCGKGFEAKPLKGCIRCSKDFYKPERSSNTQCKKCPDHSTNDSTNTCCRCETKYYRLRNESSNIAAPCYALPSKVQNLEVEDDELGSVNITWSKPSDNGGLNEALKYDVECAEHVSKKHTTACINAKYMPRNVDLSQLSVKIYGLEPGHTYTFKVFSKNSINWVANKTLWTFASFTHTLETGNEDEPGEANNLPYLVVGALGVAVLFAIVLVSVCILNARKTRINQQDLNQYAITLPTVGEKLYVDPTIYDDPECALREFANEVDPQSLSLENVIGGGEFGEVFKGTLTSNDGVVIIIAAKTLKKGSDRKSQSDFFLEASAMGQFNDPNVIHLEGVITRSEPKMIITEYMSNGSLDYFLKANVKQLSNIQLIGMARGIASGMKYLAAINFVHRDLAARNILVNDVMVCKVADFGLSRELETTDSSMGEYFTTGGRIPLRWTAPEAIKYRKFSTASDVWSYGILLWEIMTFAERPYWGWENFKVLDRVQQGYRLPNPPNCPAVVHELMLKCWHEERGERPRFDEIVEIIEGWIESPQAIDDGLLQHKRPPLRIESSTSIKDWLNDIKMSSYVPHFVTAGYEHLSDLTGLHENDLKEMGITLIGHRNKMLRSIRSLPIVDENAKKT